MAGIVIPGQPHDVVQRGNNRQDVFFVDDDRRAQLEFLREHCERFGFNAAGDCLMTSHIHLAGMPALEDSLALRLKSSALTVGNAPNVAKQMATRWKQRMTKALSIAI